MTEDTTPAETVDPADETVEVRENPERPRFDILVGGRQAGFALFTTPAENPDDQRIFYHTVIDDAFGGRGLAGVLTRGALAASVEQVIEGIKDLDMDDVRAQLAAAQAGAAAEQQNA